MRVIGVRRFTERLCFLDLFDAASSHIVCTKDTGSIGGSTLKNTTVSILDADLRLRHGLAILTALRVKPNGGEQRL
jgi:hypothetical protein